MKKPIDHDKKTGGPYKAHRPRTEEERQKSSQAMKAFNRKTGKITLQGNLQAKRFKKPKP